MRIIFKMDNDLSWIVGLMRENSNSLGFIPCTAIDSQYIKNNRYIIQYDSRGKRVGYMLHGALLRGKPLCVTQVAIQYEKRLRGFGYMVIDELIKRAIRAGSSCITLRCADDLEAVGFWKSCGFSLADVLNPQNTRKRMILKFVLDLSPMFYGNQASGLTKNHK